MKSLLMLWTTITLLSGAAAGFASDAGIEAEVAFEKLKSLAGRWEGYVIEPDGPEGAVEYRVTSGGNTLMEVLFPGTDHEMISMYFVDGDELRATHYCAMGNQPQMKLDASRSRENELHFVFTGGTNLDVDHDLHIHGGKIAIRGDRLESEWAVYEGGKRTDANRFYLKRKN